MNDKRKNCCRVYAVSIREIPEDQDLKVMMDSVDPEHLNRIRRFHRQEDFLRSLYGELLVRHVLRRRGYPAVRISRTAKGKPFCPDTPQWKFSISHGGDWVVVSISPFENGVDLEELKGSYREIYETVLTDHELSALRQTAEPLQTKGFLQMWTAKEAFLKENGEGLYLNPKEVDTTVLEDVKTLEFERNYVLSVCGRGKIDPQVKRISLDDIIEDCKKEGSRNGNTDTFYPI